MHELTTMNVQMRIITEDNINQITTMKESTTLRKLTGMTLDEFINSSETAMSPVRPDRVLQSVSPTMAVAEPSLVTVAEPSLVTVAEPSLVAEPMSVQEETQVIKSPQRLTDSSLSTPDSPDAWNPVSPVYAPSPENRPGPMSMKPGAPALTDSSLSTPDSPDAWNPVSPVYVPSPENRPVPMSMKPGAPAVQSVLSVQEEEPTATPNSPNESATESNVKTIQVNTE